MVYFQLEIIVILLFFWDSLINFLGPDEKVEADDRYIRELKCDDITYVHL